MKRIKDESRESKAGFLLDKMIRIEPDDEDYHPDTTVFVPLPRRKAADMGFKYCYILEGETPF